MNAQTKKIAVLGLQKETHTPPIVHASAIAAEEFIYLNPIQLDKISQEVVRAQVNWQLEQYIQLWVNHLVTLGASQREILEVDSAAQQLTSIINTKKHITDEDVSPFATTLIRVLTQFTRLQ